MRVSRSPLLVVLAALQLVATAVAGETASYSISVEVEPDRRTLRAEQTVRWVNRQSVATDELWFHLYLNAFSGTDSTFARELGDVDWQPEELGWIRVDSLSWDEAEALPDLECRQPDDDNPDDCTVARLQLPRQVSPGSAVELDLELSVQLPAPIARAGAVDGFLFAGQFFPKLGVFQGESGWRCHQYHATSEFFADFGTYELDVTVPSGWLVVASGVQTAHRVSVDDERWSFRAERVHDIAFAVASCRDWEIREATFDPDHVPDAWRALAATRLELSSAELELPSTTLRYLIPKAHRPLLPRLVASTRLALAWLGLHLGPYPYPQLTVVSPPMGAEAVGGMEYPTLITTRTNRLHRSPPLAWLCALEGVTVHEVAHQYFYGLVASDETELPWLDEGLTTFVTARCLEDAVEAGLLACPLRPDPWAVDRVRLAMASARFAPGRPGWEAADRRHAFLEAYTLPALALRSAEGVIGTGPLLRGLRRYVDSARWQHGTPERLRASVENEAGSSMAWLFEGVLGRGELPDWAVVGVAPRRLDRSQGPWTAVLARTGQLQAPVTVEVERADGAVERWLWDSVDRELRRVISDGAPPVRVELDPDQVWGVEASREDNLWTAEDVTIDRGRWWLERCLRWAAAVVAPWS